MPIASKRKASNFNCMLTFKIFSTSICVCMQNFLVCFYIFCFKLCTTATLFWDWPTSIVSGFKHLLKNVLDEIWIQCSFDLYFLILLWYRKKHERFCLRCHDSILADIRPENMFMIFFHFGLIEVSNLEILNYFLLPLWLENICLITTWAVFWFWT